MEEEDVYESLPPCSTVVTHMVAGAAAGVMEHSVMYPVDCVKTRMQSLVPDPKANYRSMLDAFTKIVKHEGIRNTVRGISAVVSGAGPAHAMYFACYEQIKKVLSGGQQGNHFANGVAGCASTLLHDLVMNPADVVKQRMQVYGSPYRTCMHCGRVILKREGMNAFYRSFTTQLVMNVPFQSIHFITYEIMQDMLNHDRQYNPQTHMISGGMAGAVAAATTMPLDVCKTLLNTQEQCSKKHIRCYNGMSSAFRTVYEFQGFLGFFRGIQARVVYQIPSTAISWSVYEFFKYVITKHSQQEESHFLATPLHASTVSLR